MHKVTRHKKIEVGKEKCRPINQASSFFTMGSRPSQSINWDWFSNEWACTGIAIIYSPHTLADKVGHLLLKTLTVSQIVRSAVELFTVFPSTESNYSPCSLSRERFSVLYYKKKNKTEYVCIMIAVSTNRMRPTINRYKMWCEEENTYIHTYTYIVRIEYDILCPDYCVLE